jgi:hypothetical protein
MISSVITGLWTVGFSSRSGITAERYPRRQCELLQALGMRR